MMNVLLFFWIALILSSCYGNVDLEEDEPTPLYDEYDSSVTPTPEYDYSFTLDYYFVSSNYNATNTTEESPDVERSADLEDRNRSCRLTNHQTCTINVLLMSLAALFH